MGSSVKRIQVTILNRQWLNASYVVLTIQLSEPIHFLPGQYINLRVGHVYRAYSIISLPTDERKLELCIDTAPGGPGSQFAASAPVGTTIEALAPLGLFTLKDIVRPTLFIATGAGIAPFKLMLEQLSTLDQYPVQLLWGMRHEQDVFWEDIWAEYKRNHPQFQYVICLSRDTVTDSITRFNGRVTSWLANKTQLQDWQAYLCGSGEMVKQIRALLKTSQIPDQYIHSERYN